MHWSLVDLGLSFYFFRNLSIYQPSQGWEEMEQLVYKFLAIILEIQPATVGVSLFLSDREVEYYWARFPVCCSCHTSQEDIPIKSFATAVAVWTSLVCQHLDTRRDEATIWNKHSDLGRWDKL